MQVPAYRIFNRGGEDIGLPLIDIKDAIIIIINIIHVGHTIAITVSFQLHCGPTSAAIAITDRVVKGLLLADPFGHGHIKCSITH